MRFNRAMQSPASTKSQVDAAASASTVQTTMGDALGVSSAIMADSVFAALIQMQEAQANGA